MVYDYRSPLDHENNELIKFDYPHRDLRKAHSMFPIPPTDAPTDYVEVATNFLETECANFDSPIHQDPKLPTLKPFKIAGDVFDAARI
jgi:hypothetical protein